MNTATARGARSRAPLRRLGWPTLIAGALLAFSVGAAPAMAQTGTVEGEVVTQAGTPILNAQIQLVGTQRSTATDARGRFVLRNLAPGDYQLRVSSLGYRTETTSVQVTAGATATVRFEMSTSAIALDQIVVTGQATGTARRAIGTSVASIDASALENAPVKSFSQLLQGRVAGVHVLPGGGKSGQGSRIVLRGAASVTQSNEPLIYVDGVRIDNASVSGVNTVTAGTSWSGMDDLNPADIDRIEIVRGASAATLYGTEAAAGVIQIFTKRGRDGPASWSYSAEAGLLNTPESWWDISEYSPWFYDNMVQTGHTQTHQLSVRGGGDGFDYYAAGTVRDEKGILPNGAEEHYSLRVNTNVYPRDNMAVRLSTAFTRRSVTQTPDANNTRGYTINGLVGGPTSQFVGGSRGMTADGDPILGSTLDLKSIQGVQRGNRFTGSLGIDHQITDRLTHRIVLGADIRNEDQYEFFPFNSVANIMLGSRANYRRENQNLNVDYAATFRTDLTDDVQSTTSAGVQYFHRNVSSSTSGGSEFPFFGLETVSQTLTRTAGESRLQEKSAGFFMEQQFGFRNYLFLTVGARADGHSAFGDDVDYQIYPKADLSYVVSDQFSMPEQVSAFRVRAAYGTAGQQPANFAANRTWTSTSAVGAQPAVFPSNLGNPDLKPEVTHELELGFEVALFDDRFHIDVTRFDQTTKDALYNVLEPPSQGVLSAQLRNVGEISNEGWEIGLRGTVWQQDGFRWEGSVNYSTNSNEIVSLGDGTPIQLQWLQWMREGYPVGAFFGDRPIEHNGQVGMASVLLQDADGNLPEGWDYIGPPLPTRTAQIGSAFSVGNRTNISILFDHRSGAFAQSSTMRWLMQPNQDISTADLDNHAARGFPVNTTPGPVARVCRDALGATNPTAQQQIYAISCGRNSALTHGDFAMPTDFWKLREVSVSYRLPEHVPGRIGVQSATVTLAGRDLWRSTPYIGLEPESMYRNDLSDSALRSQIFFDTPIPRTFVISVNAQF
jgi:TonB-dependent starch-binding outer membrane protein SusC